MGVPHCSLHVFLSLYASFSLSLSLSLSLSPKKNQIFRMNKNPNRKFFHWNTFKNYFWKKKKKKIKKIWSVPPQNSDSNKVFSFWVGLELCMIWFLWFFYVGGNGSCKDIALTWSLLSIISMFDTYVWCTCIMVAFEFQFIMLNYT